MRIHSLFLHKPQARFPGVYTYLVCDSRRYASEPPSSPKLSLVQKLYKAIHFQDDHHFTLKQPNHSLLEVSPSPHATSTWTQGLKVVEPDLEHMTCNIKDMLAGSMVHPTHPLLTKIASYYFGLKGKQLRPVIVLLICHAVSTPSLPPVSSSSSFKPEPAQLGLAQVVEMIHTGSLVHDDVLDEADTRRDLPTANACYGNNKAIKSGDFILARAVVSLARLENLEVAELMATAMEDLIEGEFLQLRGGVNFEKYMKKTYLKTASLIEKGCRCAAILSGASRDVVDMATEYGKNVGMAFQVVDDLLDFTRTAEELGKPSSVDLSLGLATAPVLYAQEEYPELNALIARKFCVGGDVEKARELVSKSQGIARTRGLAAEYSQRAVEAIKGLPPSSTRDALLALPNVLLHRSS